MTAPMPAIPNQDRDKLARYLRLRARNAARDRTHELIHQVRKGNITQLFPEELDFSVTFNGSPVANFVDIVARDMAEGLAPLPALACVAGRMESEADQKRAERKNRIGDQYWRYAKLEIQMLSGADRLVSYGFLPFFVEPDTDCSMPFIHIEDPRHSYYQLDRKGECKVYAKRWLRSVDDLCEAFPEYANAIRFNPDTKKDDAGDYQLELIRWVDDTYVTLLLPQRQGAVLGRYAHRLSRLPVHIARRPGDDDENPRGQFDDVIWVQVARSIMSVLALEAAYIAVQAPIAMPSDADELSVGPHAIITSDKASEIHKVDLRLPNTTFAETAALDQELRVGARYPDARSGQANASVITGKGVEALLGTFDSQIKGGQIVLKEALQAATSIAFEMDEIWWPNETKTVSGTLSGASYEFTYQPKKDIAGRWNCTVTYGFAAGLNPSQSIVTMLQLEGAGLIAKGTTQKNLPFSIDPLQEQRAIDIEGSREALKQGLFALVQSSGQLASQGQDPTDIIGLAVTVIRELQGGSPVEEAIADAYAKQKAQQEQQQAEQQAQQGAAGPPGQGPPGGPDQGDQSGADAGLPQGVAPGQAGQPPGGRPTLAQMIAGFRGNADLPINQVEIRRSAPTGAP